MKKVESSTGSRKILEISYLFTSTYIKRMMMNDAGYAGGRWRVVCRLRECDARLVRGLGVDM